MKRSEVSRIEKNAMIINIIPIMVMALAGLVFGAKAGSSAIMLDGLFSSVILITMLLILAIKKTADGPKTFQYPQGKYQ